MRTPCAPSQPWYRWCRRAIGTNRAPRELHAGGVGLSIAACRSGRATALARHARPCAGPLWRIHRAHLGPIHYNRRAAGATPYRFDAAGGEFGVLYASPSFAACMAEAVSFDTRRSRLPTLEPP
ncbi:RES domain-containing protein [Cupriavidus sp. USMAA2-4]|uniref:RES domain-containing protein n=1 Tax=Cupriavidus sp. USMAA2-4 TaxID=876364 RepID=UPI001E4625D3|nr:RES domain-containing protein [Cupriavidus sp. USMAA2-4]